jgi:hypothetical protein
MAADICNDVLKVFLTHLLSIIWLFYKYFLRNWFPSRKRALMFVSFVPMVINACLNWLEISSRRKRTWRKESVRSPKLLNLSNKTSHFRNAHLHFHWQLYLQLFATENWTSRCSEERTNDQIRTRCSRGRVYCNGWPLYSCWCFKGLIDYICPKSHLIFLTFRRIEYLGRKQKLSLLPIMLWKWQFECLSLQKDSRMWTLLRT